MKQKDRSHPSPSLFSQSKCTTKPRYSKSEAVKMLEAMADKADRLKHPNLPYYVANKYRDDTSSGLTKCVIDFLKLSGHFCERSGNEGRIIDQRKTVTDILGNSRQIGSITRVHGSGMRGTSDLKAVINGLFVAIEIKCEATNDRQSQAQKLYQQSVEKAGGIYLIATSFQQFYESFNLNFSDESR
jgi:hypothetical protein